MTNKITANQIVKGMTIKVAGIFDATPYLVRMANDTKGSFDFDMKKSSQSRLDNNDVLEIDRGTIKKGSPILKVNDIDFNHSSSYQGQRGLVTVNIIMLKTDKGDIRISTRQKVEVQN